MDNNFFSSDFWTSFWIRIHWGNIMQIAYKKCTYIHVNCLVYKLVKFLLCQHRVLVFYNYFLSIFWSKKIVLWSTLSMGLKGSYWIRKYPIGNQNVLKLSKQTHCTFNKIRVRFLSLHFSILLNSALKHHWNKLNSS